MTCFCAVNEYKLLSGGYSREVALAVLFVTVIFEMAHLIGSLDEKASLKKGVLIASLIVVLHGPFPLLKMSYGFTMQQTKKENML